MSSVRLEYEAPSPPVPGSRAAAVLMLLGAAVFWSASGIAVKWTQVEPISFSVLRGLGAAGAMAPLLAIGARLTGRARPRASLMTINALLHTVMIASFISAMYYATAAEGIFLQYSAPAWAALYAWLLLGRRIDRVTLAALAVAMAGIAIILAMDRAEARAAWLGPVLGVLAGISYGGVILTLDLIDIDAKRRIGTTTNVFLIVLIANLVTSLALLPWAIARGMMAIPLSMMGIVIAVGVVQMAAPYVLFQVGMRRVGPVAAGLIALIEPILNPIWVWLGVGEVPPRSIYFGGTLILLAVVITAVFGRRRGVETRQGEAADLAVPAQ